MGTKGMGLLALTRFSDIHRQWWKVERMSWRDTGMSTPGTTRDNATQNRIIALALSASPFQPDGFPGMIAPS
jgi:hypothetical protein